MQTLHRCWIEQGIRRWRFFQFCLQRLRYCFKQQQLFLYWQQRYFLKQFLSAHCSSSNLNSVPSMTILRAQFLHSYSSLTTHFSAISSEISAIKREGFESTIPLSRSKMLIG